MAKMGRRLCFGVCAALALSGQAGALTSDGMLYTFATDPYDTVFDHYLTDIQYTTDMTLEMSIFLETPLGANLDNVPLAPTSWSFNDGIYAETGNDMGRFNGYVSTGVDGSITAFLIQIYLDAPGSPGVWVRRNADGNKYSTAMAREIDVGSTESCWRYSTCDPIPVTEWAQDRATGSGNIAVSMFGGPDTTQRTVIPASTSAASVPLPLPVLFLAAGLAGLTVLSRKRAQPI